MDDRDVGMEGLKKPNLVAAAEGIVDDGESVPFLSAIELPMSDWVVIASTPNAPAISLSGKVRIVQSSSSTFFSA